MSDPSLSIDSPFFSTETVLSRRPFCRQSKNNTIPDQIDGMVGGFIAQASDWKTLVAIIAGDLAYRWGRVKVIGINKGTVGLLNAASIAFGLGSEVTAFEFTNRLLRTNWVTRPSDLRSPSQDNEYRSPNLWTWDGPQGWKDGWLSSLITFGTLKGFGKLFEEQNLLVRHGFQDLGILAGRQFVHHAGLSEKPEGSFGEQFLQAEVTNLQFSAGMALAHEMAGAKIPPFERGLIFSIQNQSRALTGRGLNSFLAFESLRPENGAHRFISLDKSFENQGRMLSIQGYPRGKIPIIFPGDPSHRYASADQREVLKINFRNPRKGSEERLQALENWKLALIREPKAKGFDSRELKELRFLFSDEDTRVRQQAMEDYVELIFLKEAKDPSEIFEGVKSLQEIILDEDLDPRTRWQAAQSYLLDDHSLVRWVLKFQEGPMKNGLLGWKYWRFPGRSDAARVCFCLMVELGLIPESEKEDHEALIRKTTDIMEDTEAPAYIREFAFTNFQKFISKIPQTAPAVLGSISALRSLRINRWIEWDIRKDAKLLYKKILPNLPKNHPEKADYRLEKIASRLDTEESVLNFFDKTVPRKRPKIEFGWSVLMDQKGVIKKHEIVGGAKDHVMGRSAKKGHGFSFLVAHSHPIPSDKPLPFHHEKKIPHQAVEQLGWIENLFPSSQDIKVHLSVSLFHKKRLGLVKGEDNLFFHDGKYFTYIFGAAGKSSLEFNPMPLKGEPALRVFLTTHLGEEAEKRFEENLKIRFFIFHLYLNLSQANSIYLKSEAENHRSPSSLIFYVPYDEARSHPAFQFVTTPSSPPEPSTFNRFIE